MESLGAKLRQLRKGQKLSLKQVAERVGCAPSYLSMVENDKVDPSISRLKKIAEGLGSTIIKLFDDNGAEEVVMRQAKRPRASFHRSKLFIEVLVPPGPERAMDARLAIVGPGGGSQGDYQHEGEEFGLILEGTLELSINGADYTLGQGDSFYFKSDTKHSFTNPGDRDCRILWVNHPPSW
ncbi:MAG: XRE family transcriptional regulator [Proteobacteria bacterium]|nr:XRE family transcriptional regulator [Pseudomonadota bacterium]MBU1452576.1 XRE family transcriptional regulator [Pseudomonadota bacterium]MBU2469237.1 XRE family transcriptional regulator [Pseudomonadota bacterium]MBU2517031.1 XRE family transcriptional regulator [Pseudomonadota bacterium]